MPLPTFVQEAETVFNTTTTPKSTANITDLLGDILVSLAGCENGDSTALPPTLTGEAAFTAQENLGVSGTSCRVDARTLPIASAGGPEAVSIARTLGTSNWFGGNVLVFRASDGIGAAESAKIDTGSSAPTLAITTTQDNSAICVIVCDFNAVDGTSRTWRTVNGAAATEQSYFRDSVHYAIYVGYHPDAGAAGAKTVGLSAPATMRWTIAAIEVQGTAIAAVIPDLTMAPRIPSY